MRAVYETALVARWPKLSPGAAVPDLRVSVLAADGAASETSLAALCRAATRPLVLNFGSCS